MKLKLFTFIICIASSLYANAQFTLTADGWVAETGKSFYVVEIPGTQAELYNKAKLAFTQIYKSAKDVLSYSEPDIIKANGFSDAPYLKQMGKKYPVNMSYSITVLFKDGKIRFDAPSISSLYSTNGYGQKLELDSGKGGGAGLGHLGALFKNNGDVRYKDTKQSIEDYFNGVINSIVTSIQSPITDEDW